MKLNLRNKNNYFDLAEADIEKNKETSGIIALSLLTLIFMIYFLMDIYFLEKYLRFTWSQYLQLLFALSGMILLQNSYS